MSFAVSETLRFGPFTYAKALEGFLQFVGFFQGGVEW